MVPTHDVDAVVSDYDLLASVALDRWEQDEILSTTPIIERAYLPTERELEEAETIVKAASVQPGAQALPDGRFIDAAVVATARRTLSLARRPTLS